MRVPPLVYHILAATWAVVIMILSATPDPPVPEFDLIEADKIMHFGAYLLLSFLFCTSFSKQYLSGGIRLHYIRAALIAGISYGIVIEISQGLFFAERHFDFIDIFANIIGATAGVYIYLLLKKTALKNLI